MMWKKLLVCFFLGYLGIHKFMERKIGMGLLYLFTGGLCGLGWLYDCIWYLVMAIRGGETVKGKRIALWAAIGYGVLALGSCTAMGLGDGSDEALQGLQATATMQLEAVVTATPEAALVITPAPTATATAMPNAEPTPESEPTPTVRPSAAASPTVKPTAEPTAKPILRPTEKPTPAPTKKPTAEPTKAPTAKADRKAHQSA